MPSFCRGETLLIATYDANHLQGTMLGQYRIILSADTASEVRQLLSQKRR